MHKSSDDFLDDYMSATKLKDLNDMSAERHHKILSNLRQMSPDSVNQTQLKIELLLVKLQSGWDAKAAVEGSPREA